MPVPEGPKALRAQQVALIAGHRSAMLFTNDELPLPRGMKRLVTPQGVLHYNPRRWSPDHLRSKLRQGKMNEILGLGPVTKSEAIHRALRGEHPTVVTERSRDGTELRAALGTHKTAQRQSRAMQKDARTPGSTIQVEHPGETIARRAADRARFYAGRMTR